MEDDDGLSMVQLRENDHGARGIFRGCLALVCAPVLGLLLEPEE